MNAMQIQRPSASRRPPGWMIGGGCALVGSLLVVMLCAGLYAFGILTPLILQVAGLDRIGDTNTVFNEAEIPPTPVVENAVNPPRVTLNLGEYGQETIDVNPADYTVSVGNTNAGTPIARASFTEAGLLQICNQRSTVCSGTDGRFRNASIDLRPGGAVVYADVNLTSGFWQRIGVVLQLDGSRTRFSVVGVDIDGVLYNPASAPGEIGGSIDEIERTGNDILQQVALETGGQSYTLTEVIIDDANLTLVMQ
ncbi:MAG: hypothetical protein SF029_11925 [bacterium]|nr:hypothetical protein [bacterium]